MAAYALSTRIISDAVHRTRAPALTGKAEADGIQDLVMAIIVDVISAVNGKLFYPVGWGSETAGPITLAAVASTA